MIKKSINNTEPKPYPMPKVTEPKPYPMPKVIPGKPGKSVGMTEAKPVKSRGVTNQPPPSNSSPRQAPDDMSYMQNTLADTSGSNLADYKKNLNKKK